MDYKSVLDLLFSANSRGVKFGLKKMQEALVALNNPHSRFPAIHVAGTNGKGSVVTKIAKALSLEGYRVGLYTSPHISSYRERIIVDGKMISEDDVVGLFTKIRTAFPKDPTFFEYTTLIAFCYFAEQKVDFAVLETGLGGRFDATNVCNSILSIITSISLDHTQILGNSIEEVAVEKAGIIKPQVPVLIGPSVPKEVVFPIAEKLQAPFYQVTAHGANFELENQNIAREALSFLQVRSVSIEKAIQAVPPCRFQEIDNVILDVAHNPDGVKKLLERVRMLYPKAELSVVCGFSQDKDVALCVKLLAQEAEEFHCVRAESERAMPVEELLRLAKENGVEKAVIHHDLRMGIEVALQKRGKSETIILICGSFYIMSQATKLLGISDANDDRS